MSVLFEYYKNKHDSRLDMLSQLWDIAKQLEPQAEEGLSYGLPALKLQGRPLIGFGLNKDSMSLYPFSPKIIESIKEELTSFECSKGVVRFTEENPMTGEIIALVINLRKEQLG
jgi:uncharacterized protein YdhG (YjbR/CyaY superfamily)